MPGRKEVGFVASWLTCRSGKSLYLCVCSYCKARRVGLAFHPEPPCILTQLLVRLGDTLEETKEQNCRAETAGTVHDLPVMMPSTPPKAAVSSISTSDAFISVPMHPRNDISRMHHSGMQHQRCPAVRVAPLHRTRYVMKLYVD